MEQNNSSFNIPSIIEVGKPFDPSVSACPEGSYYQFSKGSHKLILFYDCPTQKEINDIRTGKAEFRFVMKEDILFFLHTFGSPVIWSDAPYSISILDPEELNLLPKLHQGESVLLSITLVDASTGITMAMRAVTLDAQFSSALHQAIADQATRRCNLDTYNHRVDSVYSRLSSDNLANLAKKRCKIQGHS